MTLNKKILTNAFLFLILFFSFSFSQQIPIFEGSLTTSTSSSVSGNQGACKINLGFNINYNTDILFRVLSDSPKASSSSNLILETTSKNIFYTFQSPKTDYIYISLIGNSLVDYVGGSNTGSSFLVSPNEYISNVNCNTNYEVCGGVRSFIKSNNQNELICAGSGNNIQISNKVANALEGGIIVRADYYNSFVNNNGNPISAGNDKGLALISICRASLSLEGQSIDLASQESVSFSLPDSCFAVGEDGNYKKTCEVSLNFNADCRPIGRGVYTQKRYLTTFYDPISLSGSTTFSIPICIGDANLVISADPITTSPSSTIPYEITVENTGTVPISVDSIEFGNGFVFNPEDQNGLPTLPIIVEPGQLKTIVGQLTSPSSLPPSTTITAYISPARNAEFCNELNFVSIDVNVEQDQLPCEVNFDISASDLEVAPGKPMVYSFTVNNLGNQDILITSIDFSNGFSFTPQQQLPLLVEASTSKVVRGTLAVPNNPPSRTTLSVSAISSQFPEDNNCPETVSTTLEVTTTPITPPVLSIDLVSGTNLCWDRREPQTFYYTIENTGTQTAYVHQINFYVGNSLLKSEFCNPSGIFFKSCALGVGETLTKSTTLLLPSFVSPNDEVRVVVLYSSSPLFFTNSISKNFPLTTCLLFDLGLNGEIRGNRFEGTPVSSILRVTNNGPSSSQSVTLEYTLSSSNTVSGTFNIPPLQNGQTLNFFSEEVICEDKVVLEAQLLVDDEDNSNNYIRIEEDCIPPIVEDKECSLEGTIVLTPSFTKTLPIFCGNNVCRGEGTVTNTNQVDFDAFLRERAGVYEALVVSSSSSVSTGDSANIDVEIVDDTQEGVITTYRCGITALGVSYTCEEDYI